MIAAPPDRVWAALVDREALLAWLPPAGMTGRFERFDARPGGSYRLVLTYTDASGAPGKTTGNADIVEARYVDIVPCVRIVHAVDFVSDDAAYAGTMTMVWEVTAAEAGTRVDIFAEDVPDGISAKDHAAGLASSLANLAAYVEQQPKLRPVRHCSPVKPGKARASTTGSTPRSSASARRPALGGQLPGQRHGP
ncbi:SRPBCC family protein [Streptomyces sp. NPDC014991]|uniref:SRPBCC family protein n=1 Tax=Streptomyces sp. NPDC014991 TaxID=3364935 RepID=UPI0036FEB9BB